MKRKPSPPPVLAARLRQLIALWPALKGSLALVRKPCIRPACPACASGQKHPAHILAFTQKGRRRCMYVPDQLVATLQRALDNGRKIEKLLAQTGADLIREYRKKRSPKRLRKINASSIKSGVPKKSPRTKN